MYRFLLQGQKGSEAICQYEVCGSNYCLLLVSFLLDLLFNPEHGGDIPLKLLFTFAWLQGIIS
jgi:hypothetical protein